MSTFQTSQAVTASVTLAMGTLLVTAVDDDDVSVEVTPSNRAKTADVRSAEQTRVDFSDGRLTIVQPKNLQLWFGNGNSIDVTIRLPRGSRVNVDSSYGSIRVEGTLGASHLKTSYGDVNVEEGENLTLRTGYGEITVGRAHGHTEVTGGRIRIAEIDGSATIKSSQDGTFVGIVTGPLQVTSSYGDIEIDHAFAPVVAKTAYGKVRINDAVRGTIEMRSSYGELDLGIREGTAAWLDLDADNGTVRNALANAPAPQDAGEQNEPFDTVEVFGRTSWGDIIVRRAVPAR